ncbi:MAG: polysaccharide deacetylase family protein [Bacteroidia bacterium]
MNKFKNIVKESLYPFLDVFSVDWLIQKSGERVIFPFYHAVTNDPPPHLKHLGTFRSIEDFQKDLEFLTKYFQPISLNDLLSKKQIAKPSFHLTFDDGLLEFYTTVKPILLEKGIPCSIFLNTGFIDNKDMSFRLKASLLYDTLNEKNLFNLSYSQNDQMHEIALRNKVTFGEYLKNHKPYLTTEQIIDLRNCGFTFGSHSVDHPDYRLLPIEKQVEQTLKSLSEIKKTFNLSYSVFAFPFTSDEISVRFFDKTQAEVDFYFGTSGIKKDNITNVFHRIPMEQKTKKGQDIIKQEYLYFLIKKIFNKNRITRHY